MAHRGSRRGRGVRTRGAMGSRGGFRGGLARPDLNMFVVLEDQDGAPIVVVQVKVIVRTMICYYVVMIFMM